MSEKEDDRAVKDGVTNMFSGSVNAQVVHLGQGDIYPVRAAPAAPRSPSDSQRYEGWVKYEVCRRLGSGWKDLADILGIPSDDRREFESGREPQAVWEWLVDRSRLDELARALRVIDRADLAELLENA